MFIKRDDVVSGYKGVNGEHTAFAGQASTGLLPVVTHTYTSIHLLRESETQTVSLSHIHSGFVAGDTVHTPGLCFKMYQDKYFDSLILVDTQGWNSPVDDVSEMELHNKKLEEEFLRGVTFDVADVFIYVVNHISAKEQQVCFFHSHSDTSNVPSW